jgi:hypothetical protein
VRNVSQSKNDEIEFLDFIIKLAKYIEKKKIDRYETTVSQLMDKLYKDTGIPF